MNNNKKGFAVPLVLILVAVVVVGAGVWYFLKAAPSKNNTTVSQATAQAAPIAPTTSTWGQTTPLPLALETHSVAVNNGFLYVYGGIAKNVASKAVYYAPINADGTIGKFATTTPLLYTDYRSLCGVVNNNFLYEAGGIANGVTTSTVSYAPINTNGTVGAWKKTSPLPYAVQLDGPIADNGYLYIIGGGLQKGPTAGLETSTVLFAKFNADGTLGKFAQTAPLPVWDYKTCPVVVNGTIYELGGEVPKATSTVWTATPNADGTITSWVAGVPLPISDAATANVVVNGTIVMMGGDSTGVGGDTTTVAQATAQGGSEGPWIFDPPLPKITSRNGGATLNGFIYSIGGIAGSGDTSTIFYMNSGLITNQ